MTNSGGSTKSFQRLQISPRLKFFSVWLLKNKEETISALYFYGEQKKKQSTIDTSFPINNIYNF